ncbi:SAM-dependent methyltransferase [Nocardiopsis terrae]|uniref:tRNA1(Val) A37 N6-methylase TrmN6 n=1 Tax=Nocardiopsis terrae TaxID=372655 RepID=A0ABR9HFN8_9ACTN|nr:N-6 DNA methylase [Nocardiopsis terrae]MBE1457843.1 tRNA1(Val) A37 N6-methylase TrmN6 [Nocardiopsis terrae]GHC83979.1 SAM-dependent methyltransferase [Nocardiopsis terrae]
MGANTEDRNEHRPPAGQALLGASDIARLTGVKRPAVSNWRRRFSDFPEPVAGAASQPLFSLEQVRDWCRTHGKPFEADEADLLWQRLRAQVPDVRRAEFLAYLGQVLTEEIPVWPYTPGVPRQWGELAGELLSGQDPERDYQALCHRLVRERGRAETDPAVAGWMASLAAVGERTTVLDPACGTGALLAACLDRGAARAEGQEQDPHVWRIATILLHLRYPSALVCTSMADSLRGEAEGYPAETVDAVLCDPPFRDREWGHEELAEDPRWVYGTPPKTEGELAWVQHCLSRLREGGRAVVLLPASVSSRPSGRRIRANLLRAGVLRAVLEVPSEGEAAAHHLWVMVRPEEGVETQERLLLVGRGADAGESVRVWESFASGRLPEGRDGRDWTCVDVVDLLDGDADLRPARHLESARAGRAAVLYPPLLAELSASLEQARSLTRGLALDPPDTETARTTLGELIDAGLVELHRAPLAMAADAGTIPALTARDLREGRPPSGLCSEIPGLVRIRPGDVVVADTVREAPTRVIAEEAGQNGERAALGPRLLLLRPVADGVDPEFLAGALASAAAALHRTSSGRLDVRAVSLPVLSPQEQRAHSAAAHRLRRVEELLRELAGLGGELARVGHHGLRQGDLRPRELNT